MRPERQAAGAFIRGDAGLLRRAGNFYREI